MNLMCLLVSSLFLAGCSTYQPPKYEPDADRLTLKTARTLEKEKNLHLCGVGGSMMNDIQFMAMSFDYYGEVSIEEGRELITYAVELYLKNINSSEKIRPHLHNYPFTLENIAIRIFCQQKDGHSLPDEEIHIVSCYDGEVFYKNRKNGKSSLLYQETFEEALTKLHTNKSTLKESP